MGVAGALLDGPNKLEAVSQPPKPKVSQLAHSASRNGFFFCQAAAAKVVTTTLPVLIPAVPSGGRRTNLAALLSSMTGTSYWNRLTSHIRRVHIESGGPRVLWE
jgi:hypothetical protein